MEIEGFLYDALSPLSSSAAAAPTGQPPPPVEVSEPYVVFRNEILLTATHCPSPKNAAVDYFSLDVGADDDDDDDEEAAVDLIATPATPAQVPEPERTLEGGWFRANCRFKSPMLQLHKEILDFCEFLSPTPEEQASRNAAVECVFDVVRYIWPNSKVEVFGSFKTGLYLPTSDIDVVILGSDIKTPQIGLQALARALSQRGIAKKIQVIAKARVPIVKFVEKRSGVAFDISCDLQNGPKAAEFIKNAVSKMPPLRPLCLILKVFLQQRELNEVYTGGIGSYALLAMLIAMLRSLSEQQAYPEHNLGILLMIPCMHKFEQEWPLQVSVRQIWYEVRVKKAFQNLVEWTSTLKGVWKNLVREVIFDNCKLALNHFLHELNSSGDLAQDAHGLPPSSETHLDVISRPEARVCNLTKKFNSILTYRP